jgi:mono/diheme cytochrome c family protein
MRGDVPLRLGALAAMLVSTVASPLRAEDTPAPATGHPYLGQPEVLAEAERIYRARCIGCHFRGGGRGPNLFRTKLTEVQFIEIVAKGAKNGMPAWGSTLSGEEMQKLYALVISRDRL